MGAAHGTHRIFSVATRAASVSSGLARRPRGHDTRVIRGGRGAHHTAGVWMYGAATTGGRERSRTASREAPWFRRARFGRPSTRSAGVHADHEAGREPGAEAVPAAPAAPVRRRPVTSLRADDGPRGNASVEVQLQRLESRLLAEARGDPAAEYEVRRHLADARSRFATASVHVFLPILIERQVRDRLRARPVPGLSGTTGKGEPMAGTRPPIAPTRTPEPSAGARD